MGEERIGELVDKSKEIFQPRDKEMNDLREKKKTKNKTGAVEIRMKL